MAGRITGTETKKAVRAAGRAPHPSMERLRRIAWLLDQSIPLPGGYRVGWEGIVGLVPGLGDFAGAVLSSYIVLAAARLGAPRPVIVRMIANVSVDALAGSVPILGDLFDLAYKANTRNIRLLESFATDPARALRRSTGWVLLTFLVVVALLAAVLAAAAALLVAAARALLP